MTNGMSAFARDGANGNSALCVSVLPEDFGGDPFAELRCSAAWSRPPMRLAAGLRRAGTARGRFSGRPPHCGSWARAADLSQRNGVFGSERYPAGLCAGVSAYGPDAFRIDARLYAGSRRAFDWGGDAYVQPGPHPARRGF